MRSSVTTGDMEESRTLQWLRDTEEVGISISDRVYLSVRPPMVCHDGFEMSVQASPHHYCNFHTLRYDAQEFVIGEADYQTVEVFNLSEAEPLLGAFVNEWGDGIESPIGYVPLETIDRIVAKHGGLVGYDPVPPEPPQPEKPKLGRSRKLSL